MPSAILATGRFTRVAVFKALVREEMMRLESSFLMAMSSTAGTRMTSGMESECIALLVVEVISVLTSMAYATVKA
jgi:hypothetical protein